MKCQLPIGQCLNVYCEGTKIDEKPQKNIIRPHEYMICLFYYYIYIAIINTERILSNHVCYSNALVHFRLPCSPDAIGGGYYFD